MQSFTFKKKCGFIAFHLWVSLEIQLYPKDTSESGITAADVQYSGRVNGFLMLASLFVASKLSLLYKWS